MTKIAIKDLKGVGDVELNLDSNQRVFTFLGENGIGKTKILEQLAYQLWKDHFSPNKDSVFQAMAFINTKNRISFNDYAFSELKSIKGFNKVYKDDLENKIENQELSSFSEEVNFYQWFVQSALSATPYLSKNHQNKNNIEILLNALKEIDESFGRDFEIDFDESDNILIYLMINGKKRELRELSSGFLSLVRIITIIISSYSAFASENEKDLLNIQGVVFIDEIESHLHLEWQVKIIPTLKNIFKNTTFYVATHSPLVLSQLNEGEAYLLKRDDNGVVRSEIINSPNTRALSNVLIDAFGINLNQLKIDNIANIDQSKVKSKLKELLDK